MNTDYEWAPIPGASPEAEAILDTYLLALGEI